MWLAGHYDRLKKPPLGSLLSSGHAYLALFFNYCKLHLESSLTQALSLSPIKSTKNGGSSLGANNDSGSSSQEMAPTLGLGQIWDPINTQFFEGHELSQQSRRQYMEFEQSNAYDTSTQHIHWSP
ncbi:hypothetical protein Golob_015307 [Gossypium lobatum]|uniref:Uncharacterized protein n=1 Tax=Gossypium lobatum TaxID=34289 RepID=A0A7J8M0W6_9ROSI|nr:hypothetical protein [Gossypium lobatum]